jgi:hypothetical protein
MDLRTIQKINNENINAAGPRYSPIVDPAAPNLEIAPLISAIEALAVSDKYKAFIIDLEEGVSKAWKEANKETITLFSSVSPNNLLGTLRILKMQKPGQSELMLKLLDRLTSRLLTILQKETSRLYEKERDLKEHSEEWRAVQSSISNIRKLESSIRLVSAFIRSLDFKFVSTNRMLLLGEWGTGKTHLLCDITKGRISRNLPTLFYLAHRLPLKINPLEAICQATSIASSPKALLEGLDKLGKESGTRSLLIIDGINEADRDVWKKHLRDIALMISKYKNVAIILSCRTPFDRHMFLKSTRNMFVQIFHNGFQEIEFNAQRIFFKHYNIPNPHIPLLTPEFSRPLFLKILCSTLSGKTMTVKKRLMNELTSGQKTMRKLFEDFVGEIGSKIESDFGLRPKTCWWILKGGKKVSDQMIGIAVSMANSVKDYIDPKDCLSIIKVITQKSQAESRSILARMITEGLLVEDSVWEESVRKDVVRLPYQRFSDHLVSIHLMNEHLDTSSELTIRRSFYKNRPLGKIFEHDQWGYSYKMPGLASAIMLEFPERVKNTLPTGDRELVYYLPKKGRLLSPLVDTFLEGVLWRNKDSFSAHTDTIFGTLLNRGGDNIQRRTLETLVSLACRTNHPYSAERLYGYLSKKKMVERDLLWSEFLRNSYEESVIHRLLNWVDDSVKTDIDFDTAKNLILLLSLFLTTTDRALRDRATRALVLLGEVQPKALFEKTIRSVKFNDPYVPERMLAASYGVLMRSWAFPSKTLKDCITGFARDLYDSMFKVGAAHSTTHILSRDYALGIIQLARRIDKNPLKGRPLKNLKSPFQSPSIKIPSARRITEAYSKAADPAFHMDFENYTVGRLITDRRNYDSHHKEYRGVLRQIKWRMLNLGYSADLFKDIDRSISERSFYREQSENPGKIDRYGKKYSWIGFFEVAGMRSDQGLLPGRYESRMSDCDIDPSFPEKLITWEPHLNNFFTDDFISARDWAQNGKRPDYSHLLQMEEVDGKKGPWVLVGGYISESSDKDPRKVFTFINGILAAPSDISTLEAKFNAKEYPGNREIPEPWQDYYTFGGEVPWSEKYGYDFHKNKRSKRHISECFDEHKNFTIRKKFSTLTKSEQLQFEVQNARIKFSGFGKDDKEEIEIEEKTIDPSEYVEINRWKKIPGIKVEVPTHRLSWEGYHSTENQGGGADFLAPALCDYLDLRNKSNHQDLYDADGNQASVFRIFGDGSEYFKSTLFYIREDLLKKYLNHTNQKLVWFIWGERDFKHEVLEAMRSQIQDVWSSHAHIHKIMKIADLS